LLCLLGHGSYCWQYDSPNHVNCTNRTHEFESIVNVSRRLREACPGVQTQMYLNSMMNFWWYSDIYARFGGANQSLLLHTTAGDLVRVTQDGGNPHMTVYDWGQPETQQIFLEYVDAALAAGVTSFFLDKASTIADEAAGTICNHVCDHIGQAAAAKWNRGHWDVVRAVASKSPGPTAGNGGGHLCTGWLGGCTSKYPASAGGIESLRSDLANPGTSSILASFPVSTDGYAAFLQGYEPGRAWLWHYTAAPAPFHIPEFSRRLGTPLGPTTLTEGVYRRRFARGVEVLFFSRNNSGLFTWGVF